jgi:hypothetical protein
MEQHALRNVNNCWNTNIFSYLETFGGQSSNPHLNIVHFSTPELIRNLWQLKTAVFLHWCIIHVIPFICYKALLHCSICNLVFQVRELDAVRNFCPEGK